MDGYCDRLSPVLKASDIVWSLSTSAVIWSSVLISVT